MLLGSILSQIHHLFKHSLIVTFYQVPFVFDEILRNQFPSFPFMKELFWIFSPLVIFLDRLNEKA